MRYPGVPGPKGGKVPAVPEREIDYPIAGWLFEEPIPDLDELPTEGWRAVLAPLSGRTRTWAMQRVADMDRRIAAMELAADLEQQDERRADSLRRAAARSLPRPRPRPDREGLRQVNLKLRPDQAETFGCWRRRSRSSRRSSRACSS